MKNYLTGIKPTDMPHLGNLFGAILPAINLTNIGEGNFYYFIADYHALTNVRDPKAFHEDIYGVAATWMALGLDLNKAVLYKQSDIPEIFELAWILGCFTPKGDLNRAHAYKAKVQENIENKNKDHDHGVNAGLFNYPVLMAADILLFDTDIVPVGKDQVQHVEMARSMAQRINGVYGEALVLPKEVLSESGQYVPGLDGRKMSKSYGNSIPLFLTEKKLRKTINKIVTDSKAPEEPKEIEGNLIFDLYKCVANEKQINAFAARYREGISWGEAKQALFEIVNDYLAAPRARYFELMEDRSEIDKVLKSGKEQARQKAAQTMQRLRKLITLF